MKWTERTLGEICDDVDGVIQTGPFGSQLHESDYVPSGVPVIMPKNIIDGRVSTEDIAYISEENAKRLARHILPAGDIVYGRRGDIGRRALITDRERGWFCGTGCLRVSLGEKVIDPKFLYYYLGQTQVIAWIANQAIGATLPNLNTGILRSVTVQYPALSLQRRLASILSAYDDLIENNTRRIKILEQMAQTLYREWFVNFRFPGHEKAKMVGSEMGLIPETWKSSRFGSAFDIRYGKNLPTKLISEGGAYPVYGAGSVIGYYDKHVIEEKVCLVTCRGNGSGTVWRTRGAAFITNNSLMVTPKEELSHWRFFFVELVALHSNIRGVISGSAQPQITIEGLSSVPVLVPKRELVQAFCDATSPAVELLDSLHRKNTNLRTTRDLLLPKLVSGEVRVEPLEEELLAETV